MQEGSDWTSQEDKHWFHKELARYDVVIMGRQTFEAIERPLTPRNRIVLSHAPVFQCSTEHWNTGCSTVSFAGGQATLLRLLSRRGWSRVAVLGGTSIYDWFLSRNLVGEVYLTLEPVIFGAGKPLTSGALRPLKRLRLASVRRLNRVGTLLLHYTSS